MSKDQSRIIELQRSLKIAKEALEKIRSGHRDAYKVADDALYVMLPLDRKTQLQGLVGHDRRPER